jgi:hypothetical protein
LSDQRPPDGFSITLSHASPDAPWIAVAVVISKSEHRHRITFTEERPLEEVFCPELSARLLDVLADFKHSKSNGVFTNPDEEIQLPGLSLQQLRVIYSDHGDEPARALVRFAAVAGNPHRALQSEDGFSYPLEALTSQVYRDALDWVLMPAVNIVTLDEMSSFDTSDAANVDHSLKTLRASKEQLLFQIELVKRELTRLEKHTYSEQPASRPLLAAEPPQEEFRTMRALKDMTR